MPICKNEPDKQNARPISLSGRLGLLYVELQVDQKSSSRSQLWMAVHSTQKFSGLHSRNPSISSAAAKRLGVEMDNLVSITTQTPAIAVHCCCAVCSVWNFFKQQAILADSWDGTGTRSLSSGCRKSPSRSRLWGMRSGFDLVQGAQKARGLDAKVSQKCF